MTKLLRLLAFATLLIGSDASAQTRGTQAEALQVYLSRAGAPVEQFPFYNLQKWELVGPDRVVLWTRVNQAWLLTVDKPCSELEYTSSIALTSSARQVRRRFDNVIVGKVKQRCTITEIRPILADPAAPSKPAAG